MRSMKYFTETSGNIVLGNIQSKDTLPFLFKSTRNPYIINENNKYEILKVLNGQPLNTIVGCKTSFQREKNCLILDNISLHQSLLYWKKDLLHFPDIPDFKTLSKTEQNDIIYKSIPFTCIRAIEDSSTINTYNELLDFYKNCNNGNITYENELALALFFNPNKTIIYEYFKEKEKQNNEPFLLENIKEELLSNNIDIFLLCLGDNEMYEEFKNYTKQNSSLIMK